MSAIPVAKLHATELVVEPEHTANPETVSTIFIPIGGAVIVTDPLAIQLGPLGTGAELEGKTSKK